MSNQGGVTRRIPRWLRAAFVTLLSVVVTVALSVLTDATRQLQIAIGLVTILTGLALAFLPEVLERIGNIESEASNVTANLAEMRELLVSATPLHQVRLLRNEIDKIITAAIGVQAGNEFLGARARELASRFAADLQQTADGTLKLAGSDELRCVRLALKNAQHSVHAVAARGMSWWQTNEGDAWFRAYIENAERLKIVRVFILEKEEYETVDVLLAKHAAAGMETWAVLRDRVPVWFRHAVVIFDNDLIHRDSSQWSPEAGAGPVLTNDRELVSQAIEGFDAILAAAKDSGKEPASNPHFSVTPSVAEYHSSPDAL
jgi:hypothetical protein